MLACVFLCVLAITLNNGNVRSGFSKAVAKRIMHQYPTRPLRYTKEVQAFTQPASPMYGQAMGPSYGQPPMTQMSPMQMLGLGPRRRSKTSYRRSPSYLGAKSLGCRFGLDAESLMGMMMPRGCTPEMDFCPFKYPGRQCRRVGTVGMCCPFYVTPRTIAASAGVAQMRTMMEMLS